MLANEARKISQLGDRDLVDNVLKKIYKRIKIAARNGCSSCSYYLEGEMDEKLLNSTKMEELKDKLKSNGFYCSSYSTSLTGIKPCISINWKIE